MDARKIIAYAAIIAVATPLAMAAIRIYCRGVLFFASLF